jgi:outer membrane immunogenic protein
MKRFVFGTVLLSLFHVIAPLSLANAADMPVKGAPYVPSSLVPGPLWEGIYAGGNIGYAWSKTTWCTDNPVFPLTNCQNGVSTDFANASPSGILGGLQVGDRWQWGNVVFGLEGMLDGMNISKTVPDPGAAGSELKTTFSGLMSATGQLGWAFDRFLVYGKGGWALTKLKLESQVPGSFLDAAEFADGWTAGAGIEYQVIPHLILGVEYDYYAFRPSNIFNVTNGAGNTIVCAACNFSQTNIQTIMGRISFQVGPPPAFR